MLIISGRFLLGDIVAENHLVLYDPIPPLTQAKESEMIAPGMRDFIAQHMPSAAGLAALGAPIQEFLVA
jgi:hypothetical protein